MRFPLLPEADGGLREFCFFRTGVSTATEGDKLGSALLGFTDGVVPSDSSPDDPPKQGHGCEPRTRLRCQQRVPGQAVTGALQGPCPPPRMVLGHRLPDHKPPERRGPRDPGTRLQRAQRISSPFRLRKRWDKLSLESDQDAPRTAAGLAPGLTPGPAPASGLALPSQASSGASASTRRCQHPSLSTGKSLQGTR